jgi:hypothetical protein
MNVIRLRLRLQLRPDTTSFAHDQEHKIKGVPIYEKRDGNPQSKAKLLPI